jgi:hypothetical protein
MTHTIIKPKHLERTAYVYLRQSSPGQVRRNREGRQRQQAMADRVAALGWVASKIVLLDGDSGQSGSSQHGRNDFQTLLEAIVTGQAGLIAARELSRLVRDNQDWNHVVRLCRFDSDSRTEGTVLTFERCLNKATICGRSSGRMGRLSGISL